MLPGSTALLCASVMLCSSSGTLLRHVIRTSKWIKEPKTGGVRPGLFHAQKHGLMSLKHGSENGKSHGRRYVAQECPAYINHLSPKRSFISGDSMSWILTLWRVKQFSCCQLTKRISPQIQMRKRQGSQSSPAIAMDDGNSDIYL